MNDYRRRVEKYASFECFGKNMDPVKANIEEKLYSYLVCDHSREHFESHNVRGYLPQKVVNFIVAMRTTQHSFYLSRHGESIALIFYYSFILSCM
jgi:hypothetical protein